MTRRIVQKCVKYPAVSNPFFSSKKKTPWSLLHPIYSWFSSSSIFLKNWFQIEKLSLQSQEISTTLPQSGLAKDFLLPSLVKTWWECSTLRMMRTMCWPWLNLPLKVKFSMTKLFLLSIMLEGELFLVVPKMDSLLCGSVNSSPQKVQQTVKAGKECHAWELKVVQSLNFNGEAMIKS